MKNKKMMMKMTKKIMNMMVRMEKIVMKITYLQNLQIEFLYQKLAGY